MSGWTRTLRHAAFLLGLSIAALANAQDRNLLNSERIEQRFGSYGIEVLASDESLRVSDLYSGEGEHRCTRTFAVVAYAELVDAAFAVEHAAILHGGSIGAIFASAGWDVLKHNLYYGTLESTRKLERMMGIRGDGGATLAVHVYVLEVRKATRSFEYALIAEVHHPDYLDVGDLERIYGAVPALTSRQMSSLARMLELVQTQT
jgi:hypothetical protein